MTQVSESLAHIALKQAKQENHQNVEKISVRAWELYLKITRQSPGCTRKLFDSWLENQSME